jgi:membrane protease YdiL (CAAX protease family)
MLLAIPFLIVVGLALPVLAWLSYRAMSRTDSKSTDALSPRALAWQTLAVQAVVAGLAALAVWGGKIDVAWLSRVTLGSGLLTICILAAWLAMAWFEGRRPSGSKNELQRAFGNVSISDPVWLLATTSTAVSEEFAYRGVMTQILSEPVGVIGGAVASALVFGVSHFGQGWRGFIYSTGFALLMQLLVFISGGLSLAIATHFVYDLAAFAMGRHFAKREEPAICQPEASADGADL